MNEPKSYQILDGFILKVLAMIFMTLDHIGIFLMLYGSNQMYPLPNFNNVGYIFRIIGRLSLPLFTFLLAEGMRHTHNKNKYLMKIGILFGLTLLSQITITYGFKGMSSFGSNYNPIADLFFLSLVLYCLSLKGYKKLFAILPIGYILGSYVVDIYEKVNAVNIYVFPIYLRAGYSIFNLLIGLGFYYATPIAVKLAHNTNQSLGISDEMFLDLPNGRKLINIISSSILFFVTLIFWGISYIGVRSNGVSPYDPFSMGIESYCLLSIIFIYLYNGKRGYDSKWWRIFSYSYFPVHLIIIFILFYVIMGY